MSLSNSAIYYSGRNIYTFWNVINVINNTKPTYIIKQKIDYILKYFLDYIVLCYNIKLFLFISKGSKFTPLNMEYVNNVYTVNQ